MAEMPSEIASSSAQAGYQAREVGQARGARAAGHTNAVDRQVKAVDEAGNTVDTEDPDVQVYNDAEGSGSQGRAFGEGNPAENEGPDDLSAEGISKDEDGQIHLDLEA